MLPTTESVLQLRLHSGGLEHLPKDSEVCFCRRAARSSWRTQLLIIIHGKNSPSVIKIYLGINNKIHF